MADPPSHFFKFIRPGFKFNLSVPKSFSRNLNINGGREKATLRRGCHEWLVDICDKGVFGDGWRTFVIENGVQEFDFIVFKHQGNKVFDFLVFDQSTCERQYPQLFDEMDVEEPLTKSDSTYTDERSKKLKKRKTNNYLSQKEDKFRVVDDHFVIIMTPYHIKSSRLHVPMQFARSHGLTNKMRAQIILVDEAQRTCSAKLKIMSAEARLTCWSELKVNNHLKAGDVCMFKIVKNGEVPVFNFYNLGNKPVKNHIQVKMKTKSTKQKASCVTQNDHLYFTSTIKSYFKKSGLYIPPKFSIPNRLKAGEMVIKDEKDRLWKVQIKQTQRKILYIGCGFINAFCMENGLREGDTFKFELVENKEGKAPFVKFSWTLLETERLEILKKIEERKESKQIQKDFDFYIFSHKHLMGRALTMVLVRKDFLQQIYNWG